MEIHDQPPWVTPEMARAAMASGRGKGIRVAVIDSGVDIDHPLLKDAVFSDSIEFSEDERTGAIVARDSVDDAYGHGTGVAGLIHKLAPEAEIGSFKVLDARLLSRTKLICAGVYEAINRGYHILNCSFGCRGLAKFILPHKSWFDETWLQKQFVVAASSNGDGDVVEWPSHFSGVFSVGMAKTTGDEIYHRPRCMINYAARGEDVEVAWKDHAIMLKTGSSFAAPRVSGALARILSVYPHISPAKMHELLPRIVTPWTDDLDPDW